MILLGRGTATGRNYSKVDVARIRIFNFLLLGKKYIQLNCWMRSGNRDFYLKTFAVVAQNPVHTLASLCEITPELFLLLAFTRNRRNSLKKT